MFAAKNYAIFALESYSVHSCEYWGHLANFPIPSSKQKKNLKKIFQEKSFLIFEKNVPIFWDAC